MQPRNPHVVLTHDLHTVKFQRLGGFFGNRQVRRSCAAYGHGPEFCNRLHRLAAGTPAFLPGRHFICQRNRSGEFVVADFLTCICDEFRLFLAAAGPEHADAFLAEGLQNQEKLFRRFPGTKNGLACACARFAAHVQLGKTKFFIIFAKMVGFHTLNILIRVCSRSNEFYINIFLLKFLLWFVIGLFYVIL